CRALLDIGGPPRRALRAGWSASACPDEPSLGSQQRCLPYAKTLGTSIFSMDCAIFLITHVLGACKAGSADLASSADLPMLAPGHFRSVSWDTHGWPRGTLL